MKLTVKQKAFCDAYIINGGDASKAAVSAGYSKKTAREIGCENLAKPYISEYIAERMAEIESERTATLKEIQELRSTIMRDKSMEPRDRLSAASDLEKALRIKDAQDEKRALEETKPFELPARVMGRSFVDFYRRIESNIQYVLEGGRGSLKSSTVSLVFIELLINHRNMHGAAVRKVAATLRDSVFAQIKWAIHTLGLDDEFDCRVSPMEITYKKTGQKIFFRGCDDPIKLKSIKPPFGYIGILWVEEADQISGPGELRNIKQSVLRGGAESFEFVSYNPPKSKSAWVNKEKLIPDDKRVIHRSTYLDAPPEWLGRKFLDDAEHLKEVNPAAYEHEYLGVPNGDGGNVFEFLEIRSITDEEISRMDHIMQGVDWGYYPDQYAFLRTHYDSAREKIYLIDENYVNKQSNAVTGQWILNKKYDDFSIICDSAEPKSVNDYRDMGLRARGAQKGAGSVEYGFKWLQNRTLVIDPKRTPNALKEITEYEYERDKDGNVVSGYPDGNDHIISALRYAYEPLFNKRGSNA